MSRVLLAASFFLITTFAVVGFVMASPQKVYAYDNVAPACKTGEFFGLPHWYKYLTVTERDDGSCSVDFDEGNPGKTASGILLAVFEILLRIAGLVAVAFIFVGGFQFITSSGEPEKAKHARSTLLNAIIGLVITLVAAPLVSFIATRLIS